MRDLITAKMLGLDSEGQSAPLGTVKFDAGSQSLHGVQSFPEITDIQRNIIPKSAVASAINEVADFEFGQTPFEEELKWQHDRWFNLLRQRSPWKAMHSERVGDLSKHFASYLGATDRAAENIGQASKMHDIGSNWTPGFILDKPSMLDDEEYIVMKRHANDGASVLVDMERIGSKRIARKNGEVLRNDDGFMDYTMSREDLVANSSDLTKLSASIALNHHGYAKADENTSIVDEVLLEFNATVVSQLVAACDYYDAMENPRPYKKGNTPADVLDVMRDYLSNSKEAENGNPRAYLDPILFGHFLPFIEKYNYKKNQAEDDQIFEEISDDLAFANGFTIIPKSFVVEIDAQDSVLLLPKKQKARA